MNSNAHIHRDIHVSELLAVPARHEEQLNERLANTTRSGDINQSAYILMTSSIQWMGGEGKLQGMSNTISCISFGNTKSVCFWLWWHICNPSTKKTKTGSLGFFRQPVQPPWQAPGPWESMSQGRWVVILRMTAGVASVLHVHAVTQASHIELTDTYAGQQKNKNTVGIIIPKYRYVPPLVSREK